MSETTETNTNTNTSTQAAASPEDQVFNLLAGNKNSPTQEVADVGDVSEEYDDTPVSEDPELSTEAEPEDLWEVKIDGQVLKVNREEVIAGYQTKKDASHKYEEVAKARKALEAEQSSYKQELDAKNLQLINQALSFLPHDQDIAYWQSLTPDQRNNLRLTNLPGYLEAKAVYEDKIAQARILHNEQKRIQTENWNRTVQDQLNKMNDLIPEWRDTSVKNKEINEVGSHLKSLGYTDAEVNSIADARHVVVARKAWLWDQHMKQKQEARESVEGKKVVNTPKTVRPANAQPNNVGKKSTQDLISKAAKTGTPESAAEALFAMMQQNRK